MGIGEGVLVDGEWKMGTRVWNRENGIWRAHRLVILSLHAMATCRGLGTQTFPGPTF